MAAMQSGGPEEAISVCNLDAINISTEVSNTKQPRSRAHFFKITQPL